MNDVQDAGIRIARIVKLIDDIAFQTNLLALNAAVEAARAGRQGKGFSVVADEVRNLSGRSAKAARDTGAMVAAMTGRMEAGAQLAQRSDHEFREIVEATEKVAQLFADITQASDSQSMAVGQISQGLSQIDSVIQENTDNAGRTASSSLALSRQAEALRRMISRFRLQSSDERFRRLPSASDPSPGALPDAAAGRKLLDAPGEPG
jgi:methyl-accepting chemotaxis protein